MIGAVHHEAAFAFPRITASATTACSYYRMTLDNDYEVHALPWQTLGIGYSAEAGKTIPQIEPKWRLQCTVQ